MSAEGHILPFPIDFDGRPYNTLTLPCECVIITNDLQNNAWSLLTVNFYIVQKFVLVRITVLCVFSILNEVP